MTTPNRGKTPGLPTNDGSFKAKAKSPAVGIGVEDISDPFRPMSAQEFGQWTDGSGALRRLGIDDLPVFLADGSMVEVEDVDPQNETGIVERGFYVIDEPGNTDPEYRYRRPFGNLTERGQVADRLSQNAVLANRGQGASLSWATNEPLINEEPYDESIRSNPPARVDNSYLDGEAYLEGLSHTDDIAKGDRPVLTVDNPDSFWHGAEIIHSYSRERALADGVLVDHSELAKEAGFKWPVAMTAAVQADGVTWPEPGWQDEEGRAWDILNMARYAASRPVQPGENPQRREFVVSRVPRGKRAPRDVTYVLHSGPGDNDEPVITISMVDED